jgi:hypothetical protein
MGISFLLSFVQIRESFIQLPSYCWWWWRWWWWNFSVWKSLNWMSSSFINSKLNIDMMRVRGKRAGDGKFTIMLEGVFWTKTIVSISFQFLSTSSLIPNLLLISQLIMTEEFYFLFLSILLLSKWNFFVFIVSRSHHHNNIAKGHLKIN